MNELDKLFKKIIKKSTKPKTILKSYLKDEFKEINIDLTKSQLKELVSQLYPIETDKISLKINITDEQLKIAGYKDEEASIHDVKKIFNNLTKGISDKADKIISKYPKIIDDISGDAAKLMLKNILTELDDYLSERQHLHLGLVESIDESWGHSIDLLEALVAISFEAGDRFNQENIKVSKKNAFVYDVLLRLHAKACQTTSEIITLLRAGYADGALARWRTLHEISIISYFISSHGNELAERYLDYQIIDSHKAAMQFQEYADKLGYERLSETEMNGLKQGVLELDKKYGNQYKKGSYGWASIILNKVKPTFRDIEESIELDHLRPFYKMASYNVHASAKGLFFKLGLNDPNSVMLSGPSNLGFVDPCRFTAVSLSQITTNLLLYETPNMDLVVASKVLMKLDKLIEESVSDAEKILLKKEDKSV